MMCPRGFFDYMESRELKLTKLEADFYRANSSTRNESIELHGIRICLLQELVEIEETKNVELSNRIQDHQLEREKNENEIASLKIELESRELKQRQECQREIDLVAAKQRLEEEQIAREKDHREIDSLMIELENSELRQREQCQREIDLKRRLAEEQVARKEDQREIASLKIELENREQRRRQMGIDWEIDLVEAKWRLEVEQTAREKNQTEIARLKNELEVERKRNESEESLRRVDLVAVKQNIQEWKIAREKDQREITRLKDEIESVNLIHTLSEPTPVRSAKITELHKSSVKKREPPPVNKGRGEAISKQTHIPLSLSDSGAPRGQLGGVAEDGEGHMSLTAVGSPKDVTTSLKASADVPEGLLKSLIVKIPLKVLACVPPPHLPRVRTPDTVAEQPGACVPKGTGHLTCRQPPNVSISKPAAPKEFRRPQFAVKSSGPKVTSVLKYSLRNQKDVFAAGVSSTNCELPVVVSKSSGTGTLGKGGKSQASVVSAKAARNKKAGGCNTRSAASSSEMEEDSRTAVCRKPKPLGSYYTMTRSSGHGEVVVKKLDLSPVSEIGGDSRPGADTGCVLEEEEEEEDLAPPAKKRKTVPGEQSGRPAKEKAKVLSADSQTPPATDKVAMTSPGKGGSQHTQASRQLGLKSHGLAAETAASRRRGRSGVSSGGPAGAHNVQKKTKRTDQDPEDAEPMSMSSSKDSAVDREETGHARSPLAISPEMSEATSGSPLPGIGSESDAPFAQTEEPTATSQRYAQANPPIHEHANKHEDSPEIPLQNWDTTAAPKKLPSKKQASWELVESAKNKGEAREIEGETDHNRMEIAQTAPPHSRRMRNGDEHENSPEIPLQNWDADTVPKKLKLPPVRKRKSLELIASTLLKKKNEGEVSPDGGSEGKSLATGQVESEQGDDGPSGAAGHPKEDKSQAKTGPVRKRKTLVGKQARGKAELSVVDDEDYAKRKSIIRLNTQALMSPKLK